MYQKCFFLDAIRSKTRPRHVRDGQCMLIDTEADLCPL